MSTDNMSQSSQSSQTTQSNGKKALNHILDKAMILKDTNQIRKCLRYEGIESLEDLIQLSPEEIADLKWNDGGNLNTINTGNKRKLIMIQRFCDF